MPSNNSPPIALTSLSIRDFRGIDSLDLDFRGPDGLPNGLVVLGGPNGSGKTAVLEAALIIVGGSQFTVGHSDKRATRKGAADYEIRGQIRINEDIFEPISKDVVASSGILPGEADPAVCFWYFSSWRAANFVGAVNITVGRPGRRPAKTDKNRLLNVKQQLANAAAVENFRSGDGSFSDKYSIWIGSINKSWEKFYPDEDARFAVGLDEAEDGGLGSFEVFYHRKGKELIPVDDLSAGQLELFLFLAALVLNNDRQGIVFIDEPELHLDPQWHAPVVRALMELQPRAQFIVATHSPEIYDAAMSFERHFLLPEDDPRSRTWPKVRAEA